MVFREKGYRRLHSGTDIGLKHGDVLLFFTRIATPEDRQQEPVPAPQNQYPGKIDKALPLRQASA